MINDDLLASSRSLWKIESEIAYRELMNLKTRYFLTRYFYTLPMLVDDKQTSGKRCKVRNKYLFQHYKFIDKNLSVFT